MQLSEYQNRFKDLMLDHPDVLDAPPEDLAAFCKSGDIALPTRLKVYRNNIVGSLTDMLKATFPITQALVGEKFFETMARSFILQNPPAKGVLSHYGEGMDEFIASYTPAKPLPYLTDIAAYEISKNHSYHAADDAPLTAAQLAVIPPEELQDMQITLRAHVFLIHSKYPLTSIEEFCMENDADKALDLDQGGEHLMVFRRNLDVEVAVIGQGEFEFLQQISNGASLGEAMEQVLSEFADFNIQDVLQKHLVLETFRAL